MSDNGDTREVEELVYEEQWSCPYIRNCGPWAPLSEFEASCQESLKSYDLLDTESDAAFDDITQVAATVTNSPVAIVSYVDYENHRGYFKSTFGLDTRSLTHGPAPEDKAAVFCIQACKVIQGEDVFEVEDAECHQIFCRNPAVKNLGLKFYAGAVLRSPEGTPVGTLCVMDKKRRNLTEPQKRQLQILARSTEAAMEEHRQKSSRLSQDWGEIQGLGSASQAPSVRSFADEETYVAACPEASAGLPLTDFEKKCLRELSSYQILDTEPEASFDDITEVAAVCCNCPVGIVSLVDYEHRRGFFKSTFGLDVRELPYGPTSEDKAAVFCVQACKIIQGDDVFEVEDATCHQVFCNNPAVKGLGLKFYAGAILRSPATGTPLGTLCVLDREKRTLTEQQKRQLAMLARSTVDAMENHRRKLDEHGSEAGDAAPAFPAAAEADGARPSSDAITGRAPSLAGSVASAKGSVATRSAAGTDAAGRGRSSRDGGKWVRSGSPVGSARGASEAGWPAAPKAASVASAAQAAAPAKAAAAAEEERRGSPLLVAAWALIFLFLLVATALALSTRMRRLRGEQGGVADHVAAWLGAGGFASKVHGEQL